jgi:hypothetical protein
VAEAFRLVVAQPFQCLEIFERQQEVFVGAFQQEMVAAETVERVGCTVEGYEGGQLQSVAVFGYLKLQLGAITAEGAGGGFVMAFICGQLVVPFGQCGKGLELFQPFVEAANDGRFIIGCESEPGALLIEALLDVVVGQPDAFFTEVAQDFLSLCGQSRVESGQLGGVEIVGGKLHAAGRFGDVQ